MKHKISWFLSHFIRASMASTIHPGMAALISLAACTCIARWHAGQAQGLSRRTSISIRMVALAVSTSTAFTAQGSVFPRIVWKTVVSFILPSYHNPAPIASQAASPGAHTGQCLFTSKSRKRPHSPSQIEAGTSTKAQRLPYQSSV